MCPARNGLRLLGQAEIDGVGQNRRQQHRFVAGHIAALDVGEPLRETRPPPSRDLGRTPAFIQSDISLKHTIRVNERWTLAPEINVINAMNRASVTNTQSQLNRSGAINSTVLPVNKFFAGYNVNDFVNPTNPVAGIFYSPIFNRPISYQSPREVRIGLRLVF